MVGYAPFVAASPQDEFDTTELFDRILLLNKIEEGRKQIKEGKSYTTEEAKKKLKKWLN
jgi:hypothetical protein